MSRSAPSPFAAVLTLATLASVATVSRPALADYEAWIWNEQRVTLTPKDGALPHSALRIWTDARFNGRSPGLAQLFLRVGPLIDVAPWLLLGIHGTIYADRTKGSKFEQEARIELEPNLRFRIGDFAFNDRNRLEYRWRDAGVKYRYRNQLRVNYAPEGAKWIPFLWDEVLFDLSGAGVNQNRAMIGLGRQIDARVRLEAGVLLRSRDETTAWVHDRIGVVSLFVGE